MANNIFFHNGRKANAKDLEFSLLRGFFGTEKTYFEDYLGNVEGVDKIKIGEKFSSGSVSGVKILNDLEVSIKLKHKNPSFIHSLTQSYFSLVPIEEFKEDLTTWKKFPIGAGDYKVINDFDGGCLKLEKVKKTRSSFDLVNICTTYNPKTHYDLLAVRPKDFDPNKYTEIFSVFPVATLGVFFLYTSPYANDLNFRKAVYHSLNRKNIVKDFNELQPTFELLSSVSRGRANISDPYDVNKAKEYIKKCRPEILKHEFNALVFGGKEISEKQKVLAKRITDDLAKIGIKVKIRPTTEKHLTRETAEKNDFKFSSILSDNIDPLVMFASFKPSYKSFLYQKPLTEDKVFEDLYLKAAIASKNEERINTAVELSKYLDKMSYFIPYAETKTIYYINSEKIEGLGTQNQNSSITIANIIPKKGNK